MELSFILLLVVLWPFACYSQITDTTDAKLKHYKDLYSQGLIDSSDYKALRQKALELSPVLSAPQQPITVILQQPKPKVNPNLGQDEKQARNIGRTCLVMGGGFTFVSIIAIAAGETNSIPRAVIAGTVLACLSVPLWITGSIEMGRANHFRHQLNETSMSFQFSPTELAINF
jgi:hypothetical protein